MSYDPVFFSFIAFFMSTIQNCGKPMATVRFLTVYYIKRYIAVSPLQNTLLGFEDTCYTILATYLRQF